MSCSKQCFDPEDKYFEYDDCSTCPGRDDGRHYRKIYNDCNCKKGIPQTTGGCPVHSVKY